MPWSDKQKQIAVRACKAAGIRDESRKLLLLQTQNSLFDREGRAAEHPSSTSLRLNNSDFDHHMATIEIASSGRIKTTDGAGKFIYSWGYWSGQFAGETRRQKNLIVRIVNTLELEGIFKHDGSSLANWIRTRVTAGRTDRLDDLTPDETSKLIEGLKAYCKREMKNRYGESWQPWRSCNEEVDSESEGSEEREQQDVVRKESREGEGAAQGVPRKESREGEGEQQDVSRKESREGEGLEQGEQQDVVRKESREGEGEQQDVSRKESREGEGEQQGAQQDVPRKESREGEGEQQDVSRKESSRSLPTITDFSHSYA